MGAEHDRGGRRERFREILTLDGGYGEGEIELAVGDRAQDQRGQLVERKAGADDEGGPSGKHAAAGDTLNAWHGLHATGLAFRADSPCGPLRQPLVGGLEW